jgi:hypothetical protein
VAKVPSGPGDVPFRPDPHIWRDRRSLGRSFEQAPLRWAKTQMNLGNALAMLGERETGTTRLEQALVAYQLALEASPREQAPLEWATTQNNLAIWPLSASTPMCSLRAYGCIIFRPVRHPMLLLRDVVAAIGIDLERHGIHRELRKKAGPSHVGLHRRSGGIGGLQR